MLKQLFLKLVNLQYAYNNKKEDSRSMGCLWEQICVKKFCYKAYIVSWDCVRVETCQLHVNKYCMLISSKEYTFVFRLVLHE